jgi:hypothetical protein
LRNAARGSQKSGQNIADVIRANPRAAGRLEYVEENHPMGKIFTELNDELQAFIAAQHLFFVATAPQDPAGHINLSPKGLDSLRILSPLQVAYVDLIGSGVETIAHLRENGRLTLMFCAFEGRARILRLYGRGRAVEPADAGWSELAARFPDYASARSVIVLDIDRVADSCGYGVPTYVYQGERTQLIDWGDRQGPDGLARYKSEKNRASIDNLPGLRHFAE